MPADITIVRFIPVVVLNEVIPQMPLPNHFSAGLPDRFDFHQTVRLNLGALNAAWNAPRGNRFIRSFLLFDQHQDIAVRQPLEIVMLSYGGSSICEIPNQLSI